MNVAVFSLFALAWAGMVANGVELDLPCPELDCFYCNFDRVMDECSSDCNGRCEGEFGTTTAATTTTPKPTTTTRKMTTDEKFTACCQKDPKVPEPCYYLCTYTNLNKNTLIDAYFKQECPRESIKPLVVCAASGNVNHRPCCDNLLTQDYEKVCNDFCYPYEFLPGTDAKYGLCLDRLDKIGSCFENYAANN